MFFFPFDFIDQSSFFAYNIGMKERKNILISNFSKKYFNCFLYNTPKRYKKWHEDIEVMPEYNLKIIQNNLFFKFGVDSILLAKFAASFPTRENILDLCSGTGVVGLVYSRLVEEKTKNNPMFRKIKSFSFIEKQKYFAELNMKNISENNFKNYSVVNNDFRNIKNIDDLKNTDIILCNPPYYLPNDNHKKIKTEEMKIAKVEDDNLLSDLFRFSSTILKDKGELFLVHKPERMIDIFIEARNFNLEPKHVQFVRTENKKRPALILIRFTKNGNNFLNIMDDYIIS